MKTVLSPLLSVLFHLFFGLCLVIFHPIQWVCLRVFGYKAHKASVDALNFFLTYSQFLLLNSVQFKNDIKLEKGRPYIFVSNHQSMYDIPALIWFLRSYHVKFISKIELTKGIPSISFNLKYGGGANIDRQDRKQAISEIINLGKRMHSNNWGAVIFAEGTRAKDGKIKPFQIGGITTLLKMCPNAQIVPVAIENSYAIVKKGMFPLGVFLPLRWTVLDPLSMENRSPEELVNDAEMAIRQRLNQLEIPS